MNDTAVEGYGRKLVHRNRALIDQAFDELERRKERGAGDFVAKLATQMLEDPLRALERIRALLPPDVAPDQGKGGTFNLNQLFLDAARGRVPPGVPAMPVLDADVVDMEPEPLTDW